MRHVTFVRWFARVVGAAIVSLFAVLFVQDGIPVFLFGTDPLHMFALGVSLVGLVIGWKWEVAGAGLVLVGYLADLILVNVRLGTLSLNMGPIVTPIPLLGFAYLYVAWQTRNATLRSKEVAGHLSESGGLRSRDS